jgi:phosphate:Na+ symporter
MVQSSSATLGITISLASQGVISYPTAAALVLGENIGTTVTACLASLGATTNARRAAYFHIIFNLVGVFWITAIFHWYIDLVQWVIDDDVTKVIMVDGKETYNTTATIAATHSIFNITNTLLFLPFLPLFVKLLEKFVPAKAYKEKPHLTDLDIRILETPLLAIEQSQKEIEKMGDGCVKMMDWLKTLYAQDDRDRSLAERLHHRERVLDSVHDELSVFITSLLSGNVPHAAAEEARRQLRMADEYESVSDYLANLDKFDRKLRDVELRFTLEQRKDLLELHELLEQYLETVNDSLKHRDADVITKLEATGKRIRDLLKALRRKHLDDLSSGNIRPQVSVAYLAALNAYARVRDHSQNIAEAVSGEK